MNNLLSLSSINNQTLLTIFVIVLVAFIVMQTALGIVFIVALRKRRPVVKVVMAPPTMQAQMAEPAPAGETTVAPSKEEPVAEDIAEPADASSDDAEDEAPTYITEGQERVHYNRSFAAKLCQLSNESKEWYSALKNELLSYDRIKERTSWRRETFRMGRMSVARLAVRGKTLCLLLAVEPIGYSGTKYKVEDVSNVANTVDTPTLYRIKSARRLKYAKEMISGIMKELKIYKKTVYEAQDYFMPYQGDMALIQSGLVKRVVSGSTRVFKIEEVDDDEQDDMDLGEGENE